MTNRMTLTQTIDAILADMHHDDAFNAIRSLLLDLEMPRSTESLPILHPLDLHEFADLDQHDRRALLAARDAIAANIANPYNRDELTDTLLSFSLCPLHAIDYAICFDDDDADCAMIRMIHPSHDT